jgi:hypothetical protein
MLTHRHAPDECRIAFAAWRGFESPLRRGLVTGSCHAGGHCLWWTLEACDEAEALGRLPPYVAARTQVAQVTDVRIP